ncbi:SRPBCC family protein [Streptomyces bobili]|uniref:SRPBCC family protein n=1 Tax=Streptomyces bobili TaxID=67280 RepID=UPI00365D303C
MSPSPDARGWTPPPPGSTTSSATCPRSAGGPNATDVAFDQDAGPRVGAWFSGRNHKDGRQWTTRSQIVRADPGTAFTFVVGGAEDGIVRWSWTFRPQGRGTVVQQSWQLLRLDPVLGTTRSDLDALRDYMADSAETTLASLAQWIAAAPHPEPTHSPRRISG